MLVRWLPEAINGAGGGLGDWVGSGPDSKLLTFGPLYYSNPHVWEELQRCLGLLEPIPRKHLLARYHEGVMTRRKVRFRKSGPVGLPPACEIVAEGGAETSSRHVLTCVVHTWPAWVSLPLVGEATRCLERTFRGSVDVPRELAA